MLMKGKKNKEQSQGFTLIELLVAMAIFGIVMAGIYTVYHSQQKAYQIQMQVSAMQQNLRAATLFLEREIRMAGYDPTKNNTARIITANAISVRFTMDLNGDGDVTDADEDILYSLYDADGDGDMDLGRTVNGVLSLLAENMDALNFVYLDKNGLITTVLNNIRSVQLTLVARAGQRDTSMVNNQAYRNQQGTVIYTGPNDNFRRRLLVTQIKCRNIGLP